MGAWKMKMSNDRVMSSMRGIFLIAQCSYISQRHHIQNSLISVTGSLVKIKIILTLYISSVNISEEKEV